MKSERENYDLIEKYLANELSGQEKTAFEEKAKTDKDFAEEVIAHTLTQKEIEAAAMAELKARVKTNLTGARRADIISMRQTRMRWFSVAAVILILIACIPLIPGIMGPSTWTSDQIYTENFEIPGDLRNTGSVRSVEDGTRSPEEIHRDKMNVVWDEAVELINQKDYQGAIDQYEVLLQDSITMAKAGSTIRFQTGVVWLLNENPEKAIEYFHAVRPNTQFGPSAKWYTGMAYLKLDNREAAKTIFEEVAVDENQRASNREKAAEILERL